MGERPVYWLANLTRGWKVVGSNLIAGNGFKAMPGSITIPNPGSRYQMKRKKIQTAKWATPKNTAPTIIH